MTTYLYSTQATATFNGVSPNPALFTISDYFIFDDPAITAASLTSIAGATDAVITGAKIYTLTGFSLKKISSTNFSFADSSKLQIGDGTTGTTNDDLANVIVGTDYNDYFDGLLGSDTVSYAAATSGVTIDLATGVTAGGAGIDKLLNIENAIGSVFSDTLIASASGGTLDGGAGMDILTGGAGADTFVVTAGDTVSDSTTGDADLVISSVDYTLPTNVEKLTLTGSAIQGVGNAVANTITGNTGNNILDGGTGGSVIDTLIGLAGNDTYIVNHTADVITEAASAGTDSVQASVTYVLGDNVENLRLMGAGNIDGTGNTLANIVYANSGNNTLDGVANTSPAIQKDTLSYQFGAAAAAGVTANLTTGVATGSGTDAISNFDNLIGTRFGDSLTGDANANVLTGGLGNDTLTGASANDTLDGGAGNDTYVIGSLTGYKIVDTTGTDTVEATITGVSIASLTNIENITAKGAAGITVIGNSLANTLTSASSGTGLDNLQGGTGNDTYVLDSASDTVTEASNAGTDTVKIGVTGYTLAANVENLTLTASGIAGTGNGLANIITAHSGGDTLNGGDGNDKLIGGAGNDTLDGQGGNDNMAGGAGDDTYVVGSATDTVNEVNGTGLTDTLKALVNGNDTVQSSISYTLGTALENLELGTGNINGTGNTVNNIITGNTGKNILTGNDGDDTLNGGAGNDTLLGGKGADSIDGGTANDVITGGAGKDTVATGAGRDTIIFASGVTDTVSTATSIAGVDSYSDLNLDADNGDLIDLTVIVANVGTLVTGSLTEATFVADMNTLLNVGGGAGFDTATTGDIAAAIVTANAGDLDERSFLAVDLDKSGTFTATDFVIELTGTSVLTPTSDSFI